MEDRIAGQLRHQAAPTAKSEGGSELNRMQELERSTRSQLAETRYLLEEAQMHQLRLLADFKRAYVTERQRRRQLQEAYMSTIKAMATVVAVRDDYTGAHVERVRSYSTVVGRELGLDSDVLSQLEAGAFLHDIGKIGLPDAILVKPEPLDPAEWKLLTQHPITGANLLREIPFLTAACAVVASHHERWDGDGYPFGLEGEGIPLGGRIVAVTDAFDTMTTSRVYRSGSRNLSEAVAEIARCSGSQFDPVVVDAFLRAWGSGALR